MINRQGWMLHPLGKRRDTSTRRVRRSQETGLSLYARQLSRFACNASKSISISPSQYALIAFCINQPIDNYLFI